MAFQIHYKVPFMSFRSGTLYTVNIFKEGSPSGGVKILDAAEEPFVTQEDDDCDMFADIRTQTGTITVLSDNDSLWSALAPNNDIDTPITLTHQNGNSTIIDWQGFVQANSFGRELYGDPQELSLEVHCPLSVLEAKQVAVTESQLRNFAYLLKYIIDEIRVMGGGSVSTAGTGVVEIKNIVIGGGTDALAWIKKKFDWRNFVSFSDDDEDQPKYSIFTVLEDTCKFWGWTARVKGTTLYLTNADDPAEQNLLTLTYAQLSSIANEQNVTVNVVSPESVAISGDVFTDRDNDEMLQRGPNKAVVSVDCNRQDTVMSFAPAALRKALELNTTWEWVSSDEEMVGYFETRPLKGGALDTASMWVWANSASYAAFSRRQVFESADNDSYSFEDTISLYRSDYTNPIVKLQSKRPMAYGGGSLKVRGIVRDGTDRYYTADYRGVCVLMSIGIGTTYNSAKWLYLTTDISGVVSTGWSSQKNKVRVQILNGNISGFFARAQFPPFESAQIIETERVPIDEGLYGCLYVDIYGGYNNFNNDNTPFSVANLSFDFDRESVYIPSSAGSHPTRTFKEERASSRDYTALSQGKSDGEWNADCIFASDNNMEFGYGLLMNADGTFMEKATYGNNEEYPEQHLANRVVEFWQYSRKIITSNIISAFSDSVDPSKKVLFFGETMHPLSISRDWYNDVTTLTLIKL